MQSQNQFKQNGEQGSLDLRHNGSVIGCSVDPTEAGTLVPGQAVKVVDNAGGVPKVIGCDANADDVFGFIAYDIKSVSYVAGDACEVAAFSGNVMYMTAGEAIGRNAEVGIDAALVKVMIPVGASGDRLIGRALDKAAADGDLIRVYIDLPSYRLA